MPTARRSTPPSASSRRRPTTSSWRRIRISIRAPSLLATACLTVALLTPGAFAQTIDAYDPLPGIYPASLTVDADGKVVIVGNFLSVGPTVRTRVARLNIDGSIDATFQDPGIDGNVMSVAIQADGKLLIGGDFESAGGQPRHYLARLNHDGSLDSGFVDPDFDSSIFAIAVQPDGKILAGGNFSEIAGHAQNYFARLDANGAFDPSFADPQLCCDPLVNAVALQADGHILIGGAFSQAGGTSHDYFARYSANGTFDPTFPDSTGDIGADGIMVAPDGSLFVSDGGLGTILKLTPTGAPASGYMGAITDGEIESFVLQPDGKILIGGTFESVGGQPHHALARLNANGSVDPSFADLHFNFDATNPQSYIYGIAEQADGNTVVIGNFTLVGSTPRNYMARVVTGDSVTSALVVQAGSGNVSATWYRTGDGPELAQAPLLQHSTDGVTFTTVDAMTRVANGWQANANYDVHGARFYLRVLGTTSNGTANSSAGQVASEIYSSDTIFQWGFE